MKKVEIPMIERKDNNKSDIDNLIESARNGLKKDNNIEASSISKSNISNSIDSIYKHVSIVELWNKYINYEEFTRDDLISLYDIYNVRYNVDKKLKKVLLEMIEHRNLISDMAKIFDCDKDEIAYRGHNLKDDPNRYVVLLDALENDKSDKIYSNLRYIRGNCNLYELKNINDKFPVLSSIGSNANFASLLSAKGLENLKSIGGYANFESLTNTNGLDNLEIIGNTVDFSNIIDASGLSRLSYIYGYANFESLTNTNGLDNLKYINDTAYFDTLLDASHLTNLEYIGGTARFPMLKSTKGLEHLSYVGGYDFASLNYLELEKLKKSIKNNHEIKSLIKKL